MRKKKRNISYKIEFLSNFNKMYIILGGLIERNPEVANMITEEELNQLISISNSPVTNFIDNLPPGHKTRFSNINSIYTIVRNNYKGKAKVNIFGFTPANRYHDIGIFIFHEIL